MVCPLETRILDDQQRPLGGTTLVALGGEFHGTLHVIGHTGEALPVDQRGTGGSMEKWPEKCGKIEASTD